MTPVLSLLLCTLGAVRASPIFYIHEVPGHHEPTPHHHHHHSPAVAHFETHSPFADLFDKPEHHEEEKHVKPKEYPAQHVTKFHQPLHHQHSHPHQHHPQHPHALPHHLTHHQPHHQPYHEPHKEKNYKFKYSVHDEHTGDIKSHHEEKDGDVVKGFYTLKESDGSIRKVVYAAGKHGGFNAIVEREYAHSHHHPLH